MVDVLLLAAFIAFPLAAWWIGRSLLLVSVWLGLGIGVAGNLVQSSLALGVSWNVRGLQVLVLAVMALVLVMAWRRRSSTSASLIRQFVTIVVPAVVIGGYLLAMRLLAPDSPGPLSGVGYLINHPLAEDNAKWLHLTAQLADGRDIAFSGYAGGPLLLVMSIVAALISVLSMVLLGGVNEVAVATNTLIGTQFLLIALTPFAFAAFAERTVRLVRKGRSTPTYVPAVLVWTSMLVLMLASSVITSYGHLSLQFVFLVLVGWATVFVMTRSRWLQLASTLVVITTASVWLPMTAVAMALIVALLVWTIRRRWWWGIGTVVVTVVVSWDALFSSSLYLLGIDAASLPVVGPLLSPVDDAGGGLGPGPSGEVIASAHLFRAPGATELATPILGALAAAAVVAAVWVLSRGRSVGWRFAPLVVVGAYAGLIALMDSVTTASSPNYSLSKLLFALSIMAVAAYLPLGLMALDVPAVRMTPVRWAAAGSIVLLLAVDTLLPRALSALSPLLWPSVDANEPAYWSAAEVKNQPEQPLESLPIACLFAPPQSQSPTSLPLGQESYACTRLLTGLSGVEGTMSGVSLFLQTDWLSQRSNWSELREVVAGDAQRNPGRAVILMDPSGGLAGLSTLDQIADFPAS